MAQPTPSQGSTATPSLEDIYEAIVHDRVDPDIVAAMYLRLIDGESSSSAWLDRSDELIRIGDFHHAVTELAEMKTPLAKVVLGLLAQPGGVDESSAHYEKLVAADTPSGAGGDWGPVAARLRTKGRLFTPASPAIAINAYARLLGVIPDDFEAHLKLAKLMLRTGDLGRAEKHYRQLLANPRRDHSIRIGAMTDLMGLIHIRGRATRDEGWQEELSVVMGQLQALDGQSFVRSVMKLADRANKESDPGREEFWYRVLLEVEREEGQERPVADTLSLLGSVAEKGGADDRAARYYEEALAIYDRLDDRQEVAGMLWARGRLHVKAGELDEAEKLLKRCLKLEKRFENRSPAIGTLRILAEVATKKERQGKAEELLMEAAELAGKVEEWEIAGDLWADLARLARERDDARTVRDRRKRAIGHYERAGVDAKVGWQLGWIAAEHIGADELDAAAEHLHLARARYERTDSAKGLANCYLDLALVDQKRGAMASVEGWLVKALELLEASDDEERVAATLMRLGDAASALRKVDQARNYWMRALVRFRNLGRGDGTEARNLMRVLEETAGQ